jgi:hypothetical protein
MARIHVTLASIALVVLPYGEAISRAPMPAVVHGRTKVPEPLVVHEWGTITTRHASDGTPQGRLNHINPSEVLPPFVHRYEPPTPAPTPANPGNTFEKTVVGPGRPDVTMRLETPVIYFHVPAGTRSDAVPPFNVSVRLRGGILNEFYPNAEASVALDFERINAKMNSGVLNAWDGAVLNNYVVGSLLWSNVALNDSVRAPKTASGVWLAPRRVRASGVVASNGEGERYLFYRGVAHLEALMRTELSATDVKLRAPQRMPWLSEAAVTVPAVWLVDVRADGRVAFREKDRVVIPKTGGTAELARLGLLTDKEFGASGRTDLRASMRRALIGAGLFDDEADAMLETWKESYFRAPGLRLFYIVPREWIDYFLPLEISVPNALTRVLVGRIDLIRQ